MLVSASIRHDRLFAGVRAVVVDEVHAFAGDDRGWHLLALLQRIGRLAGRDLQRIGLSATVGNPDELLAWLSAGSDRPRRVIRPPAVPEPPPEVAARLRRPPRQRRHGDRRPAPRREAAGLLRQPGAGRAARRRAADAAGRDVRLAQLAGPGRAPAGRAGVRRGPRLRDRRHQRAGAGHRRRRPRPGDPDRRPGHRLVVPAADGPHRAAAGQARNCLFLATSDEGLLRAAGLVDLWAAGFVEPAVPPPEPLHILAQQLLALASRSGGSAGPSGSTGSAPSPPSARRGATPSTGSSPA